MGLQCTVCHSTVDNSFALGIEKRLDGWANRRLNVGRIAPLAPNFKPFGDLLGVDVAKSASGNTRAKPDLVTSSSRRRE